MPAPQQTVISSAAIHAMPAGAETNRVPVRRRAADVPLRAASRDGDGPVSADFLRERRQIDRRFGDHTQAPAGMLCRSPQREPAGSTF